MAKRSLLTDLAKTAESYLSVEQELIAELFWPTRCVICDTPGKILCDTCRRSLPYLDRWSACEICGAPWGGTVCTECNTFTLHRMGRTSVPFDECRNAVLYKESGKKLVRAYKDQGQQQLAETISELMVNCIEPRWLRENPAIVAIPTSRKSLAKRGFDHMQLVAERVSRQTGLPRFEPFLAPESKDQRKLDRAGRFDNMRKVLRVREEWKDSVYPSVLLVDDVLTTGATLFAAAEALKEQGAQQVYGLTFARVP